MRFLTPVVVALCWATRNAAATDSLGQPQVLQENPELLKAEELLIPDLSVGDATKEGSLPNNSAVDRGIEATVASVQSYRLQTAASVDTLQKKLVEKLATGDKAQVSSAAAEVIRGTAALMQDAKAKSETVFANLEDNFPMLQEDGLGAEVANSLQSSMDEVAKALKLFPKILSYLENHSEEPVKTEPVLTSTTEAQPSASRQLQYIDTPEPEEEFTPTQGNDYGVVSGSIPLKKNKRAAKNPKEKKKPSSSCDLHQHHKLQAVKSNRHLSARFESHPHARRHLSISDKLHQAADSGDHKSLHRHLKTIHTRVERASEIRTRRLLVTSLGKKKKKKKSTPSPTPRPTRNPTPRPTPRPTRNPTPRPTPRPVARIAAPKPVVKVVPKVTPRVAPRVAPKTAPAPSPASVDKAEQCKLFMECVGQMSIYDMILYYYSDDIDDNAGEIDDNIYRHATAPDVYDVHSNNDVARARDEVIGKNRPVSWFNSNSQRNWCDRTLRLFFRNVEYGAVPHWEGATVSKVCLAQGSHTYVKLDQIATKVGFQAADEIAEEMFTCSKDLYNSNANPRKSPFPFASHKIGIDKGGSSIVESNGSYGGVTGGMTTTQDSKYKMFDNNLSSYWRSRDGTKGYPTKLKIRANTAKCVWWDSGDSNDYLRSRDCSDSDNRFFWYYDKNTKQIKSRSNQGKCMEAKSNGGNDKVSAETCTGSRDRQRWVKDSDYGAKNEGRNKCLSRGSGQTMYVKGCGGSHEQDLLEIGYNDFFTKMIPPTVEFKIKLTTSTEIKGIEIKWKDGEECPHDKLSMKPGLSGGSNFGIDWSDAVVSGSVRTQTAVPTSTVTSNGLRILCNNPLKRIGVYEIQVYGSISAGSGSLPTFSGEFARDFMVPSGVETGSSSRDRFGQVKGTTVTLYKYDDGLVANALGALQTTMDGTMKKVWDWLKTGTDNRRLQLRTRYTNPSSKTKYENSDSYVKLLGESEDDNEIEKQMVIGFAKHIGKSYSGNNFDDREEEWEEFNNSIETKYGSVQDGFNMVFGKDASVGYVCGIESAVEAGGAVKFPGTCCLDAPYQNPGGEWGREFDCSMTCKTKAPFFSGLSEESCSAVGGTWCPSPTNCIVLKTCIDEEIETATDEGKMSYVAYLEPGKVEDHQDFNDCGNAREYFGFDELYLNDEDVCENMRQLRNSKDFKFLDEVYAQGTPVVSGPKLDWEELEPVDTGDSQSNMVQDGPEKFAAMYALSIIRDSVGALVDGISEFKCNCDSASGDPCITIKNLAFVWMHVLKLLLDLAYNSWEHTHAVTDNTNNIQPIEDWEILQAQHGNNEIMHDGTKKAYEVTATMEHDLLGTGSGGSYGKIGEILDCLKNPNSCGARRALMAASPIDVQFAGCDGRDQDSDGVIDNCEEDHFPPEVSVQPALEIKDDGETKHLVGKIFQSAEIAVSSLHDALSVVDDCAGKSDLSLNLSIKETTKCQALIAATPSHRCGDSENLGKTEHFTVSLDSTPPVVSCGFQSATGSRQKLTFVEEGSGFFDALLSLKVEDTCSDSLDVHVSVLSNEFDTNGPSAYLALAEEEGSGSKANVPKLYLDQATCLGTEKPGFCEKSPVGSRVYTVVVEATDGADWSASDTCQLVVTPKNGVSFEDQAVLLENLHQEEKSQLLGQSGSQNKLQSIQYVHQK